MFSYVSMVLTIETKKFNTKVTVYGPTLTINISNFN